MSLFDRLFGRTAAGERQGPTRTEDEIAVGRYQQVLSNAPAEKLEQVHLEAFNKLTPAQLDIVFERFTQGSLTSEDRPSDARPSTLARTAARVEKHQPGALTRTLGEGFDGAASRSVLNTVAGYVIASEIVSLYLWSGIYTDASGAGSAEAGGAAAAGEGPTDFNGGDYVF